MTFRPRLFISPLQVLGQLDLLTHIDLVEVFKFRVETLNCLDEGFVNSSEFTENNFTNAVSFSDDCDKDPQAFGTAIYLGDFGFPDSTMAPIRDSS